MERVHQPGSRRWKKVALLSGATTIFFWQLRHPLVRFAWPIANQLVGFVLGLGLPWLLAIAIFRIGRWWSTAFAVAGLVPLLLYTCAFLLVSAMTGFAYKDGRDLSFDRVAQTHWRGSQVSFYRTNGGATTDFGIVIRQERTLVPGLVLVRELDNFYPCYSLATVSTDPGITITDERSECEGFQERRRHYQLKPFVYF